ncbi:DNA helicase RecQ [Pseudothioclava nitratireducens]|uniref:DNA helicase RecQ n=1 Tax=Pseudothioclava nitratireducens TaxID=1928646 RepID=UPI0023D9FFDD|nr:DNA helicase RecQ [Defluviimonas nitratireducens]MDF1619824.1 DNA helicase RecQ [Defluviimonas nitratireducens]
MADGLTAATPEGLLASVFGFQSFRPGQEDIVRAVIAGRDTLAIMPTGGGKSLCFQLPALCLPGLTVVISPLIALMRDQVRGLREAGVEAGALTSGNTEEETEEVFAALDEKRLKLLYMAPERLASGAALALLRRNEVSLIAVDEAHCVSQWGHDFRPDYLRIGDLKRALGVPLAAFTATADEETRTEIVTRLFDGRAPETFLRGFDRPNIHLAFEPKNQPRQQILRFAEARKGQSGIVYCASRAKTEALAKALVEAGHAACHYHGGMEADDRRAVEARFQREDGLIVVATVAFGMGIDKPDIRWVAHADLPKSIEGYYQEIGRAGRDGAPAETLTLYGPEDIRLRRAQIDEGLAPPDRKAADHGRLNALLGLAEATACRRVQLLGYFGEVLETPCGHCDLCETPPELFDATEPVRKALSAALRTEESYGAGHLIEILLGQTNERITSRGHDRLPTFGVGKDLSRVQWQAVFRQMLGHDLMRPDLSRHGALVMTKRAHPILRGEERITLRRDLVRTARTGPVVRTLVSDEDAPLLSALKAKRRALAEAAGLPAYMIFNDKTLIEMAETRPMTVDAMARINGVGAKKLESYGDAFLEVIAGEVAPMHPARRKLAGRDAGALFDRLAQAQLDLQRGADGTERPLSLSTGALRKIAEMKPRSRADLARVGGLNEARLERFAERFLEIIEESD